MKKHLVSRIFGLAALYCVVFCIVVVVQFSNKGSFTLAIDAMSVKGHYNDKYIPDPSSEEEIMPEAKPLAGGVRLFYGGLEFNLKDEREKGMVITGVSGSTMSANPQYMITTYNSVHFGILGGSKITFTSVDTARGSELQIQAEFPDNVSEISIPIAQRRSSLVHENGQLGISYGGDRYTFVGQGQEIENGKLLLSKDNNFISYRSRGKQSAFYPENYIIAQAQNYDSAIATWREQSFTHWNRNTASLQNEDDITAYCSEALRQGNYLNAVSSVSSDFFNSARHTHKSSAFIGGMGVAFRTFTTSENDKTNLVRRAINEKSLNILKEEHIIDYLFTRSNNGQAFDIITIINEAAPEDITADHTAGLLETYADIKRWRPSAINPVESLMEQILLIISENLNRDSEGLVYASNAEGMNLEYSLRLGKALYFWAEETRNQEWSAIGRSLVLSALTSGGAGAGWLYNTLRPGEYNPKAVLLADGMWAWTVSPSSRASSSGGNIGVSFNFPVGLTHHVIIKGVRPFVKLQIHDMDWSTDSQFERYDSSGWVYYAQEQILVVKLRHRTATETVKIIYVSDDPLPEEEGDEEHGGDAVVTQ
jgi:hypothetical protein